MAAFNRVREDARQYICGQRPHEPIDQLAVAVRSSAYWCRNQRLPTAAYCLGALARDGRLPYPCIQLVWLQPMAFIYVLKCLYRILRVKDSVCCLSTCHGIPCFTPYF